MRRKEIIKSAWDLISYGMQQAGMSQSEIEEYLHNNQKDISNFIEKKFSKYKTKKDVMAETLESISEIAKTNESIDDVIKEYEKLGFNNKEIATLKKEFIRARVEDRIVRLYTDEMLDDEMKIRCRNYKNNHHEIRDIARAKEAKIRNLLEQGKTPEEIASDSELNVCIEGVSAIYKQIYEKKQAEEAKRVKAEKAEETKRIKAEKAEEAKRIKAEKAEEAKKIRAAKAEETKRVRAEKAEEARRVRAARSKLAKPVAIKSVTEEQLKSVRDRAIAGENIEDIVAEYAKQGYTKRAISHLRTAFNNAQLENKIVRLYTDEMLGEELSQKCTKYKYKNAEVGRIAREKKKKIQSLLSQGKAPEEIAADEELDVCIEGVLAIQKEIEARKAKREAAREQKKKAVTIKLTDEEIDSIIVRVKEGEKLEDLVSEYQSLGYGKKDIYRIRQTFDRAKKEIIIERLYPEEMLSEEMKAQCRNYKRNHAEITKIAKAKKAKVQSLLKQGQTPEEIAEDEELNVCIEGVLEIQGKLKERKEKQVEYKKRQKIKKKQKEEMAIEARKKAKEEKAKEDESKRKLEAEAVAEMEKCIAEHEERREEHKASKKEKKIVVSSNSGYNRMNILRKRIEAEMRKGQSRKEEEEKATNQVLAELDENIKTMETILTNMLKVRGNRILGRYKGMFISCAEKAIDGVTTEEDLKRVKDLMRKFESIESVRQYETTIVTSKLYRKEGELRANKAGSSRFAKDVIDIANGIAQGNIDVAEAKKRLQGRDSQLRAYIAQEIPERVLSSDVMRIRDNLREITGDDENTYLTLARICMSGENYDTVTELSRDYIQNGKDESTKYDAKRMIKQAEQGRKYSEISKSIQTALATESKDISYENKTYELIQDKINQYGLDPSKIVLGIRPDGIKITLEKIMIREYNRNK